jgi:ABC-2 type transport system permease protein
VRSELARSIVDEWRALLGRRRGTLVVLLAMPLFYPLVVSQLYRADTAVERPAVLVDEDNSAWSRELALSLDATMEVRVVERAADAAGAQQALEAGRAELAVIIPADFSSRIARGEQAEVRTWVTAANLLTYGAAYPGVVAAVGRLNQELGARALEARGVPPESAAGRVMPVRVDVRSLWHPSQSYGGFLLSGVFLLVVQQLVIIGLMLSTGLVRERAGLADLAAPRPFLRLLGRGLAQSGFHVGALAFMTGVVAPAFGWPVGHVATTNALLGLFLVATMPLAIVFAAFAADRYASFQLPMFLAVPMLMMSGFAWPTPLMPAPVQAVAAVFPATPALQAMRILAFKTGSFAPVRAQLVHLGLAGLGWFVVALVVVEVRAAVARWKISHATPLAV